MRQALRIAVAGIAAVSVLLAPGVAQAVPPANDDFADRISITALPFSDSQDTSDATTETGEPDPASIPPFCGSTIGSTVWYQFTPSSDTIVGVDTFGSDFDTLLGVYTGPALNSLTLVVCNDDASGLDSEVVFKARGGTTYLLQAGGYAGEEGALEFHVKSLGPILPKKVDLVAKPRTVAEGEKVKLTATVSPCSGHQGDNVEFYRGSKKIATKASNDICKAVFKAKVTKATKFHAVSPVQDGDHLAGVSNTVRVKLK